MRAAVGWDQSESQGLKSRRGITGAACAALCNGRPALPASACPWHGGGGAPNFHSLMQMAPEVPDTRHVTYLLVYQRFICHEY